MWRSRQRRTGHPSFANLPRRCYSLVVTSLLIRSSPSRRLPTIAYTENRWLTQTLTYSLQTPPRIAMPTVLVVGAAGGLGHRTALVLAAMPGGVTVRGLVRSLAPSNAGKQQVTCIHCTVLLRIGDRAICQPIKQYRSAPGRSWRH